MSDTESLCVLHHNKPATSTDGLLCAGHYSALREGLQDVLELFALVRLYLLPGSVVSDGSKHTKAAEAPAPIRLDVAALSDRRNTAPLFAGDIPDVPGILEDWAGWVVDERQLTPLAAGWSIADSVRLLHKHLPWISEQAMVDDLDESVRSLRRSLASASGERPKVPVGRCPSQDGNGETCNGPLWPRRDEMAVDCGRCERHYDERILRHLGGMMEAS